MRYVVIFFVISMFASCQAIKDHYNNEKQRVYLEDMLEKKKCIEEQLKKEEEYRQLHKLDEEIASEKYKEIVETIKESSYKVDPFQRYKLYTTANIYNSLLLDTQTGIIKQVQWSFELEKEYSIYVNSEDLTYKTGYGSFELYPTQNQFTYILLDKMSGRKWHVQWGFEDGERWIRRIY